MPEKAEIVFEWDFYEDTTLNTVYSFDLCGSIDAKYAVLAKLDLPDSTFIGVYGWGDTKEAAMEDVHQKISKLQRGIDDFNKRFGDRVP